jgi:glutamate-1-semialdehyde 2,1-aminomutase
MVEKEMAKSELMLAAIRKYEDEYRRVTPKSAAHGQKAMKLLPGGNTRNAMHYEPYPLYIDDADGCRLHDDDGREYIDLSSCFSATILGHAHPKIVEVITKQVAKFTALSAPTESVNRWAELLLERLPSMDKVRFANSGNEAVMMAIRGAIAYTGKEKLVKMEGCYHGIYDFACSEKEKAGIPKSRMDDSFYVPFNNKEQAEKVVREHKDEIAAVIVEPVMGACGIIAPKDDYLPFLRKITAENDVLLIFDEVFSFRLDWGGMQRVVDVAPDITTLGKVISSGFACGAFGGREDIMRLFDPRADKIHHGGTLNANPLAAAAGIVSLSTLTPEEIARINRMGERMTGCTRKVFADLSINCQINNKGSLMNIHFTDKEVVDARSAYTVNADLLHLYHMACLVKGLFLPKRGFMCISVPMTDREVDTAVGVIGEVMRELKPIMEKATPHLLM